MALESNRVGVRHDQVDTFGRVTSQSFLNELLDCLPEWTDMPVYKGGTEEILPSNTAVPTTSPIVADIKYPDGMRQNQVFTYRETPAEVDGLAKIKSIKGNTLVWNQIVENGNFVNTTGWTGARGTLSASNNILTFTSTSDGAYLTKTLNVPSGHKFLFTMTVSSTLTNCEASLYSDYVSRDVALASSTTTGGVRSAFVTTTASRNRLDIRVYNSAMEGMPTGSSATFKNIMLIDLTQMFGAGNEPTTVAEFTSLFPLPYYTYNTGTLLNFNGTGIKTVGFNQWDEVWENGYYNRSSGAKAGNSDTSYYRSANFIRCVPNTYYHIKPPVLHASNNTYMMVLLYDGGKNYIQYKNPLTSDYVFYTENAQYMTFYIEVGTTGSTYQNDVCVNISSSRNGQYEPFTINTTDLPASDYYPTGLKSAGSVYDELTPTKAITRIGAVDLGTLNWSQRLIGTTPIGMQTNGLSATIKNPSTNNDIANIISTAGTASSWTIAMGGDSSSGLMAVSGGYLFIATTETNPTAFKSAMSGVYLNYELATPVELPTLELE